jgi:hypothetical protein
MFSDYILFESFKDFSKVEAKMDFAGVAPPVMGIYFHKT